jgi:DNA polymerase III gamma/tau subunit
MTAVEVVLLLIGVVFLLGSFFITEKLSPEDISRVAQLSEDELQGVMNRELEVASAKISDMVDNAVDLSVDKVKRSMEKASNEKIMAIGEYSETVMEQLKKTNNEVTFLYSMLGDKHEELRESMVELNELMDAYAKLPKSAPHVQSAPQAATAQANAPAAKAQKPQANAPAKPAEQPAPQKPPAEQTPAAPAQPPEKEEPKVPKPEEETAEQPSQREVILARYRDGEDLKKIARDLGMGYGEVKLIVELYKGDEDS